MRDAEKVDDRTEKEGTDRVKLAEKKNKAQVQQTQRRENEREGGREMAMG